MANVNRQLELIEVVIQCPNEKYHCIIKVKDAPIQGDIQGGNLHITVPCKCGKTHIFTYDPKEKQWDGE